MCRFYVQLRTLFGSFTMFPSRVFILFMLMEVVLGTQKFIVTTDELDNYISPEDLREFMNVYNNSRGTPKPGLANYDEVKVEMPDFVECFGFGSLTSQIRSIFNMRPDSSDVINTHFYFASRHQPTRVQVFPGKQFGLEWTDFNATRKTVLIVHGFMSHSNSSWVHDMTTAFLKWGDVNVIAVDWSAGGNTWKYWRAVANTRQVGTDIKNFLLQLKAATGVRFKDFHFVGHSLGAHICSYASQHLGGVARITGLDPAQPCFSSADKDERLDETHADFVDVIHTNGRLLKKVGFGLPEPSGHADFYPNGGMKQPGCHNKTKSSWSSYIPFANSLLRGICDHGRAYVLFTESLLISNCSFRAYRWNLTYEGVNSSLIAACDKRGSCSEMGINAVGGNGHRKASGQYFVLTSEKAPYCPTESERRHPRADLLHDLLHGFRLSRAVQNITTHKPDYADPMETANDDDVSTTTTKSWFRRWFG